MDRVSETASGWKSDWIIWRLKGLEWLTYQTARNRSYVGMRRKGKTALIVSKKMCQFLINQCQQYMFCRWINEDLYHVFFTGAFPDILPIERAISSIPIKYLWCSKTVAILARVKGQKRAHCGQQNISVLLNKCQEYLFIHSKRIYISPSLSQCHTSDQLCKKWHLVKYLGWPSRAFLHCHLHPLQAANCCRNSRSVVNQDGLQVVEKLKKIAIYW